MSERDEAFEAANKYADGFRFGSHRWEDLGFLDAYKWVEAAFESGFSAGRAAGLEEAAEFVRRQSWSMDAEMRAQSIRALAKEQQ